MQLVQLKTLDTGRRVQSFLDGHAPELGAAVTPVLRQRLDDAVAHLVSAQLAQGATSGTIRGEVAKQAACRRSLYRRFLRPISRIAKRTLRDESEYPKLIVRARILRIGDFFTKATNAADAAAVYEQKFIDNGMAPDFIAQLRAGIARLNASIQVRTTHETMRSAATAGIEEQEKDIRDIVGIVHDNVAGVLEGNPALLSAWNAARRVHHTGATPQLVQQSASDGGTTEPVKTAA